MNRTPARFASALLLCLATGLAGVAYAHGDIGPVEDLQAHIGDYEKEVADMSETIDQILVDYKSGESVTDRVDDVVGTWEEVEFHEAVETHAMVLYPPIWIAFGGLREAVDENGSDAEARKWHRRLEQAFHEGIGALKLAATQQDSAGTAETAAAQAAADADDRPTIVIIKDNLQTVVDQYRAGDPESARTLLHQTYMQRFEGIEGDLIERDADLVTDLEKDFNGTLPLLMEKEASADEVGAQVGKMNTKLDRAQTLLDEAAEDQSSVF